MMSTFSILAGASGKLSKTQARAVRGPVATTVTGESAASSVCASRSWPRCSVFTVKNKAVAAYDSRSSSSTTTAAATTAKPINEKKLLFRPFWFPRKSSDRRSG